VEEEVVHLLVVRKQRKRKFQMTRYNIQRHAPSNLLPPSGPTS
jgi:hypothetical protein